jgi:hypothetical protein
LTYHPSRVVPALKSAIPLWLENWKFDRFVTLATNDSSSSLRGVGSSLDRVTDLLKEWDGRMHRKLVGSKWSKRVEDRMWAFYFLEKPSSNPHWHGLVQFNKYFPGMAERQAELFDRNAEKIWKKLVPAGTVKSIPIYEQRGVADYVSKTLPYPVSYEHYVTPDQF